MGLSEVVGHAFPGVVVAAGERSRGALGAADEHGPLRIEVLDLEVHSFVPSVADKYSLPGTRANVKP